jgi:ABC-type multidrug transport system fused ATPase/permease subunit
MSDAMTMKAGPSDPSDRQAYFEQRIFVLSPLGTFATAAVLFLFLMAWFFATAFAEGVALITRDMAGNIQIESALRMAFTLTLMLCAALFIQRYTRVQERKDKPAFAAVLRPGTLETRYLTTLTPPGARLPAFTAIGIAIGILVSWPLFGHAMLAVEHPAYATFIWFFIVDTLLITSFTRGVELSRAGSLSMARAIDADLVVDLLRIDLLSVWGRSAARFALIWFTVSAVACLFFIGNGLNAFTIAMLATFLALGIWMFIRPMERVHHRIREAKAEELERVRGEIDQVRAAAVNDANAATRLQGLLAYETRISAAPEWPFDQTTLFRVIASALILTVPWFGQAVAQFAIDHLAH